MDVLEAKIAEARINAAVKPVTERLLLVAIEMNLEPYVFALACADALAAGTAIHDRDFGAPSSVADRLDAFNQRFEQTYQRTRLQRG